MPAITARQSTKTDATPQPLAPSILVVFLHASSALHRAIAVVFVLAPALVSSGPCSFTSALAALPVHTACELVSSANNILGTNMVHRCNIRGKSFNCRRRCHFIGCDKMIFRNPKLLTTCAADIPFTCVRGVCPWLLAPSAISSAAGVVCVHLLLSIDHRVTPPSIRALFTRRLAPCTPQSIFAMHFPPHVCRSARTHGSRRHVDNRFAPDDSSPPTLPAHRSAIKALGQSNQTRRPHSCTRLHRPSHAFRSSSDCSHYSVRLCLSPLM